MSSRSWIACACVALFALFAPAIKAQVDERLQRDQAEILRRAERLEGLMQSLKTRYEKEGHTDKVQLLEQGLQHLQTTGLLDDVAKVRNDLDAGALAEAQRKQQEIIQDLESLLDILLERRSVESLTEEMQRAEALRAQAAELARRQEELARQTDAARTSQANATETQLQQELARLAQELRREADENRRQAGTQRPTLEAALDSVLRMLRDQAALEERLAQERSNQRRMITVRPQTGRGNQHAGAEQRFALRQQKGLDGARPGLVGSDVDVAAGHGSDRNGLFEAGSAPAPS